MQALTFAAPVIEINTLFDLSFQPNNLQKHMNPRHHFATANSLATRNCQRNPVLTRLSSNWVLPKGTFLLHCTSQLDSSLLRLPLQRLSSQPLKTLTQWDAVVSQRQDSNPLGTETISTCWCFPDSTYSFTDLCKFKCYINSWGLSLTHQPVALVESGSIWDLLLLKGSPWS